MTFKRRFFLLFMRTKRCTVCGRRLTTAVDRARGMGRGCFMKEQIRLGIASYQTRLPKINKDGGEDL